jgi:hypothetical protein
MLTVWLSCSELHFFIKQRRAVHFAWLSGAGIYHGGLNFGAQNRCRVKLFFVVIMNLANYYYYYFF